jgi:ribosomal protein S8
VYEKKEALLQTYYQLTRKLVTEMTENGIDIIQALLNERQGYIAEINQIDQGAGQILMNPAIEEQLLRINPLEVKLKRMLERVQQKVLSNIHALKKEKTIKHYGEATYGSSGLFYDKRK